MIFDIKFFLLLAISSAIYWQIPRQNIRNLFLSVISLGFIYYLDKYALIVVIFLTVYTYAFGFLIETKDKRGLYHKFGIIGLILALIIFKYLGLLSNTFNGIIEFFGQLPVIKIEKILLPLGLSYIIFKYISYLTDIYWRIVKKGTFAEFLLYGSLFTIFFAGPIERFEKFKPQIETEGLKFKSEYLKYSFDRIVYGLFKKFVIADWIAYLINPILKSTNENSIEIKILALFGYSIQIYMDFSGYSDIAIGSSKLFGITIMENFNYPYLKQNISQFWRSWHISLSDWIRDYIFMPLSRYSNNKVWFYFFVPLISMGICGIWHGASFGFLVWGLWHGLGISIFQIYSYMEKRNKRLKNISKVILIKPVSILITFVFVTAGWIFFIYLNQ